MLSKSTSKAAKGNVIINKPGVTLSNTTVSGNLIIADGVGNKEVTLDNVTVTGKVIVRGGGANSVIIKGNSAIGSVIVKTVNYKVSIKVQDNANVSVIRIKDGSNDVNIVGAVGSLVIDCADIDITLSAAEIGTVTVTANAKGATVDADKDSSVENVVVNAEGTKVTGDGAISGVEINAPNTTVDASSVDADKVKVSDGVSGVTVNGQDASSSSNTGSASSGSSSDSSSSTESSSSDSSSSDNDSSTGSDTSGGNTASDGSSSDSGSTGGDTSGGNTSGGNTASNVGGYQTDSRFAEGYPKYEVNSETNQITVAYKLADSVDVSETNPIELFTVASFHIYDDESDKTNSEAVLHGHFGITEGNTDGRAASGYCDYKKFKSHEEASFTYTNEYNYPGFVELSVLRDASGNVSTVPTM